MTAELAVIDLRVVIAATMVFVLSGVVTHFQSPLGFRNEPVSVSCRVAELGRFHKSRCPGSGRRDDE